MKIMSSSDTAPKLSIIIPCLDEEGSLPACLKSIKNQVSSKKIEIILSDGGSSDTSLQIASQFPVTLIHAAQGRAQQMNAGARCARGETLLFLHADTQLPTEATHAIIKSIERGYSMGCFERRFFRQSAPKKHSKLLTLTCRLASWRARKTFLVYGDQCIFIKRNLFLRLGGYRKLKRFEDLDLAMRARHHGCWAVLPGPIVTDSRRFGRHPLSRVLKDAWLTLLWLTGVIDE